MDKYMQTTVTLENKIRVYVDFAVDSDGRVNYAESSIGGQAFDEGFLSEYYEADMEAKCLAYAASVAAEARDMRIAA